MPRIRRLIRAAIVASLGLVMLVLARPAFAATASLAPFCDDRGATAIAPSPTLQATDEAVQQARNGSCNGDTRPMLASIARTRLGMTPPADTIGPMLPRPIVLPFALAGELVIAKRDVRPAGGGVSFRVERPPRS